MFEGTSDTHVGFRQGTNQTGGCFCFRPLAGPLFISSIDIVT